MAIPHLRFPFQVIGDKAAVVEQNSYDEIAQCVQIVLTTSVGERIEVPTYGVSDPVFSSDSQARQQAMIEALNDWEPRWDGTLDITIDNVDEFIHHISVQLPDRPDDSQAYAMPQALDETGELEGFGMGGWGIEPWGE